jgi:hypothetical protein
MRNDVSAYPTSEKMYSPASRIRSVDGFSHDFDFGFRVFHRRRSRSSWGFPPSARLGCPVLVEILTPGSSVDILIVYAAASTPINKKQTFVFYW